MSKKYEHRIEKLEEHEKDKGRREHHAKSRSNVKNKGVSQKKKDFKDFKKKMEKSKKIW